MKNISPVRPKLVEGYEHKKLFYTFILLYLFSPSALFSMEEYNELENDPTQRQQQEGSSGLPEHWTGKFEWDDLPQELKYKIMYEHVGAEIPVSIARDGCDEHWVAKGQSQVDNSDDAAVYKNRPLFIKMNSKKVKVFDVLSGQKLREYENCLSGAVAISFDGKKIAHRVSPGIIEISNLKDGKAVTEIVFADYNDYTCTDLVFSPDDKHLGVLFFRAGVGYVKDQGIVVWNIPSKQEIGRLLPDQDRRRSFVMSKDTLRFIDNQQLRIGTTRGHFYGTVHWNYIKDSSEVPNALDSMRIKCLEKWDREVPYGKGHYDDVWYCNISYNKKNYSLVLDPEDMEIQREDYLWCNPACDAIIERWPVEVQQWANDLAKERIRIDPLLANLLCKEIDTLITSKASQAVLTQKQKLYFDMIDRALGGRLSQKLTVKVVAPKVVLKDSRVLYQKALGWLSNVME